MNQANTDKLIAFARRESGTYSWDTPEEREAMRAVEICRALVMEVSTGLWISRHVSAYALAKREFGLTGNKMNVLGKLAKIVKERYGVSFDDVVSEVLFDRKVKP